MSEQNIEQMLGQLAQATAEPAGASLAQDIKRQIPQRLPHRTGLDTISIIIDLRISRLAAAAAIIITMALFAAILGVRGSTSDSILDEYRYVLAADGLGTRRFSQTVPELYKYLVGQGREATYYGDSLHLDIPNAILMHWRLPDGNYRVVFTNGGVKTVTADELIRLQSVMLKSGGK